MEDPSLIRLLFFLGGFGFFALWELISPRKQLTQNKKTRCFSNLGLVGLNSLCIAIVMPILAFQAAQIAENNGIGIFNLIELPFWLKIVVSVLLLDLAIYVQHVTFHHFPLLWKLHRVHHADQDIDVTTGSRFHPIEIILSLWIKIICVVLLGAPAIAVLIFEVLLNVSAMFNHSNGRMPLTLDKILRKVIVTPDMHRVHHSIILRETHSNFGFFLSIWDQIFKTYHAQPKLGHDNCIIGIKEFREPREQFLDKILTQPFRH